MWLLLWSSSDPDTFGATIISSGGSLAEAHWKVFSIGSSPPHPPLSSSRFPTSPRNIFVYYTKDLRGVPHH